jgi:hypothetical protein
MISADREAQLAGGPLLRDVLLEDEIPPLI